MQQNHDPAEASAGFSLAKNLFLTDWQRSKEAARQAIRTRRRTGGTVECGLRCKSKCLAQQAFANHSMKNNLFRHLLIPRKCHLPQRGRLGTKPLALSCVLTVGGFFDTLDPAEASAGLFFIVRWAARFPRQKEDPPDPPRGFHFPTYCTSSKALLTVYACRCKKSACFC